MKPKAKTSKIVSTRRKKAIAQSGTIMPFEALAQVASIPHKSYSATTEWFADRLVLAFLTIGAIAFAGGVLFVLRWSQPLGDSQFYGAVTYQAQRVQEGVLVYSQQVIDVASPVFALLVKENREEIEPEVLVDQLAVRKEKLKAYLASKGSPFAEDDLAIEAFASSKNMKLMVAISFVESTFGKHCYYYNCSGIGGTPPNLRKYENYAEWIADFDQILENRYKDVSIEKFVGLYVQPGSPNWLYGVKQVLAEFDEHGIEG